MNIQAARVAASKMAQCSPPCPWNPFPRNSAWGRKIESLYQADRANEHIQRQIMLGFKR